MVEANNQFFKALNTEQETSSEELSSDDFSSDSEDDSGPSADEIRKLTPKLTLFQKLDVKTSFVSTLSDKMSLTSLNKLFPEANVSRNMYETSRKLDLDQFGILRSENVTFSKNLSI